jgi:hypothetical protein
MLNRRADGTVEAMCSRCLASSPLVDSLEELLTAGWELRDDGQTFCVDCSAKVRHVRFPTNQRGVRRKRR